MSPKDLGEATSSGMSDQKTILVVDDEDFFRNSLIDKLKQTGFSTLGAKDGDEAMSVALKEHPDLILLDVIMPKSDGMTVMRKLREDSWGVNVPIILLTQLEPDDKMLQEIVESKPTYYLVKSKFRFDEVVERVKERLS
jgi:DNA-binding response OmpR family regulator